MESSIRYLARHGRLSASYMSVPCRVILPTGKTSQLFFQANGVIVSGVSTGQPADASEVQDGDDRGCSVSSLRGTYAMQAQGTIVGQIPGFPPPPFPFAEAGIIRFDANGNLSGHSTVNVGGVTFPAMFTGTYAVSSDCTGTLTVNLSNGLIAHDATVVVRGGQGFRDVQTDSFGVITRNGERIGD